MTTKDYAPSTFVAPLPPGEYFVGYFTAGGYSEPLKRNYFTVVSAAPDSVKRRQTFFRSSDIYRIDGQRANNEISQSTHGIYIHDGKKYVK